MIVAAVLNGIVGVFSDIPTYRDSFFYCRRAGYRKGTPNGRDLQPTQFKESKYGRVEGYAPV